MCHCNISWVYGYMTMSSIFDRGLTESEDCWALVEVCVVLSAVLVIMCCLLSV